MSLQTKRSPNPISHSISSSHFISSTDLTIVCSLSESLSYFFLIEIFPGVSRLYQFTLPLSSLLNIVSRLHPRYTMVDIGYWSINLLTSSSKALIVAALVISINSFSFLYFVYEILLLTRYLVARLSLNISEYFLDHSPLSFISYIYWSMILCLVSDIRSAMIILAWSVSSSLLSW